MAEDIWSEDTGKAMTAEKRLAEVRVEALRQEENCLYTSTAMYRWLGTVRWQSRAVLVLPILLAAFGSYSYSKDVVPAWGLALVALVATLIPSIAKALDIETHVKELRDAAGEYKNLQDRFRQLANIGAIENPDAAEARLSELMDRLDAVRAKSLVVPQRHFENAQKKIKSGDYDFTADIAAREATQAIISDPMPPRQ
jgi:hypothetical protein